MDGSFSGLQSHQLITPPPMRLKLDQRQSQRIRHSAPVVLRYMSRSGKIAIFRGTLLDVSRSGFGIKLSNEFWGQLGGRTKVNLEISRKHQTAAWSGFVARCIENRDGSRLLGIDFDKARYEALTDLSSYAGIIVEVAEDRYAQFR